MEIIKVDWKKLRNGENVECPQCKEGRLTSPYDHKISHFFQCDKCGMKINCD